MKRFLLASVVAGSTLFAWGFVSHVVLPWYDPVWQAFPDEAAVSRALAAQAPRGGLFYLPYDEGERGPDRLEAFVNVIAPGSGASFGLQAARGWLLQIISALLVVTLVARDRSVAYWSRVRDFGLAGLIIAFVSHVYYWNWFGFPAAYLGVTVADGVLGWTAAGLACARFLETARASPSS